MDKIYYGIVQSWDHGYGFILDDQFGESIFVHHEDIKMPGFRSLQMGQRVRFQLGFGKGDKMKCKNVEVITITRKGNFDD